MAFRLRFYLLVGFIGREVVTSIHPTSDDVLLSKNTGILLRFQASGRTETACIVLEVYSILLIVNRMLIDSIRKYRCSHVILKAQLSDCPAVLLLCWGLGAAGGVAVWCSPGGLVPFRESSRTRKDRDERTNTDIFPSVLF
jgi:hypothetical protein